MTTPIEIISDGNDFYHYISPLPCPRCGGQVLVSAWDPGLGDCAEYTYECTNESCDYFRAEDHV